jgi:LytS/YehU family sensor histidine kinase
MKTVSGSVIIYYPVRKLFKHGVESLRANAWVKINMISLQNNIQFEVENNFDSSGNKKNKSGIGLKNLERRLELIYPNRHKLSASVTENVYKAQLSLNCL